MVAIDLTELSLKLTSIVLLNALSHLGYLIYLS